MKLTMQQVIKRLEFEQKCHLDVLDSCKCDICMGACNNGDGGVCGECFACEEIND